MSTTSNLDAVTDSLPESFAFYHLGEIASRESKKAPELQPQNMFDDHRAALAYTLRGDLQAAVVLMIEPGLDLSMYSEAGNIIASRLATQLAEKHGIDVILSPPARLQRAQLELLAKAASDVAEKTYVHIHAGKEILLEALIFVHSSASNAAGSTV
jgi:hypothetical protein